LIGLSGVFLTAVGVFAFAGALFASLYLRRPSGEDRLAAVLSFDGCAITFGLAQHPARADLPSRIGLLLAFALVAHLGFYDSSALRKPARVRATYAIAIACAALDASGVLGPRRAGAMACACGAIATLILLRSASRRYISGRRECGAVILGAGLLLVTLVSDGLDATGLTTTGHLAPLGLLALVSGLAAQHAVEHALVWNRLESTRRELRTRTRELRESHDELRATRETLSSREQLAAVGELAAVVAHEVRNPLAILGNAVAGLRKASIAPTDRATLLEIIDSEATRLNRIVTDLLSFSRPVTLQRGHVQLNELIDRALKLVSTRAEVNVDQQMLLPGARVWADSNLLRQVFDNLIDNAIQAMESGGTLTVRVRSTADAEDEGIAVDIIDTGEGMDAAVRGRAKDPFFTTRPSGTGLGLAIVDRIVDAHGGRLEIDSRAGEGTKVTVHLPTGSSEPPSSRPLVGRSSKTGAASKAALGS
jgi:signal transduction histidine kinase